MNIVNVAMLKENLSYYLSLVRSDEEVVVTSNHSGSREFSPATASAAAIIEPTRLGQTYAILRHQAKTIDIRSKVFLENRQHR